MWPQIIFDAFTEVEKPRGGRFIDLTGRTFGRLTVISYAGAIKYVGYTKPSWNCLCVCGNKVVVIGQNLRTWNTKSCGCLHSDVLSEISTTHGESNTPEYVSYTHAKSRCMSQSDPSFQNYGGRGIEFRFDSYEQFLVVVGRRPTPKHTIDRIDNNGHYEPGNVRWGTRLQQARNTRNTRSNHMITINGVAKCLTEWAEIYGVDRAKAIRRLRSGWCDECAITLPLTHSRCHHR